MSRAAPAGIAAAALLLASQVHPALAWLAWLVSAPLFALHGDGPPPAGRALRDGALAGTVFAASYALAAHAPWLAEAGVRYFALPRAAAVAGAVVLALGCGVAFGVLLGLLLACARTLPVAWAMLAYGAVWAVWESATLMSFPSYPWLALAATQTGLPVVVQTASVAGQAGLSFVVAAVGAALGWVGLRARAGRLAWRPLAAVCVALGAVVAGGALRLRAAPQPGDGGCTIAGVDAGLQSGAVAALDAFDRHAAATRRALALRPDVVVWPESALPEDPQQGGELLSRLRALADRRAITLLVGAPRTAWGAGWTEQTYNSVHRIAPGRALEAYDKRFPVPIAERWPWTWVDAPGVLRVADVAPGERSGRLDAGRCALGVMICFEAERAGLARELATSGADALVIASNDAPLPRRAVAAELAQARLRAVETGLPLLRVANAGDSVAIDRYGRIVARGDGVVALTAAAPPRLAPATRWSTPFLLLCAAGAACGVVSALAGLVRRRAPRAAASSHTRCRRCR